MIQLDFFNWVLDLLKGFIRFIRRRCCGSAQSKLRFWIAGGRYLYGSFW